METLGKIFHVNFLIFAHWFMSISILQFRDHSTSVDQARYSTNVLSKYLDNATVKESKNIYKTTLPYDKILTKDDACTSDEKVEKFSKKLTIKYRACIGSLVYLFYSRIDLSFLVLKVDLF